MAASKHGVTGGWTWNWWIQVEDVQEMRIKVPPFGKGKASPRRQKTTEAGRRSLCLGVGDCEAVQRSCWNGQEKTPEAVEIH